MLIIVINMPGAKDRLEFQQVQHEQLGLNFHRLVAFTPKTIPGDIPESYWQTWERPLTLGERACFLSHRAAWKIAADVGPALILEDDAALATNIPDILRALEDQEDMDHLSLETRKRRKLLGKEKVPLAHGIVRRRLYLDRTGAAAYVLWPSGAKKLLARAEKRAAIADGMICQAYELKSFQADPACAFQLDMAEAYGIDPPIQTASATGAGKRPVAKSLVQKIRRIVAQLRMGWRMFRLKPWTRRKHVPVLPEFFD